MKAYLTYNQLYCTLIIGEAIKQECNEGLDSNSSLQDPLY